MKILFAVAMLVAVSGSAAQAASVVRADAGSIFHNLDAQRKCPAACEAKGGTWDGNWRTEPGTSRSTCDCKLDSRSHRDERRRNDRKPRGRVRSIEAGAIGNDMHAKMVCPRVCESHGRLLWDGNWRTTQMGRMSECDCVDR